MSNLDRSLEDSWRGLITDDVLAGKESETKRPNLHWLKKRLEETRQAVADTRARLIFQELHLAAGERVLKEHEK
ncbi:hypothetical protein LCGC14_2569530 [marine sediment metagenome]|uniref:Uncharacterized protein n=1 Tax=marine sediment metagenome TaxID=412755 RepID=A0A0F9AI33_9ZZZZ